MIYFDSDVLINYFIIQTPEAHAKATKIFANATDQGLFFVSLLSLQEIAFVLAKLQISSDSITKKSVHFQQKT